MFCPNCGTENREDAIYCSLCQEPLQKYTQEQPQESGTVVLGAGSPSPTAFAGPTPSANVWQPAMAPTPSPQAGFPAGGGPPPPGYQPFPSAYPGSSPYPNPSYYQPYPVMVAQQTPGEATAALVLGILGLIMCPIIFSLLAIIFGKKALNMIDASGGYLGGRGLAQAGYVMGIVGMAIYTVIILIYIIIGAIAATSSTMMFVI